MPGAKIKAADIKAFDAEMRAQIPDWPGIRSEKLRAMILDRSKKGGNLRKAMVETMALAGHQQAGFPDIGSTRFAISERELIGQPTGVSGLSITRPKLDLSPSSHGTYDTQIGGEYLGGLDTPIPRDVMFPDFYAARRAAGKDAGFDDRAFSTGHVSQMADQKWLDGVMKYLKSVEGQKYGIAGAVAAGLLTAEQAKQFQTPSNRGRNPATL
jgi:hypothetical protein